jgi:hypothetical protein
LHGVANAQQSVLDIPAMHQLINQSETEYDRQNDARNKQSVITGNEKANLALLDKVKLKYRELQNRYNTLGTAISITEIGVAAAPMLNRIISNQAQIVSYARKNPALVTIGYETELSFIARAKSLMRYVTGLSIAIGDVNQMKASDRKILFDFIMAELSTLQELSANMVNIMQYANLSALLKTADPFRDFIDADKALAAELLQNARYLR